MIFDRLLTISQAMWEPLGVIFYVGLGILLLRFIFGNARRNIWAWLLVSAIIYAFGWRYLTHIRSARYHNIFIFIGLFSIVGLWENIELPSRWKRILLFMMLILCSGRDLMYNPQDQEIRKLYRQVELESQTFAKVLGVSYTPHPGQHGYYTKLPMCGVDRPIPIPDLLKNLENNFSVYDADFNAVYFFCKVEKRDLKLMEKFLSPVPGRRIKKIGVCALDTHRKKWLVAFRYLAAPTRDMAGGGTPIFNGDFSQLATEKAKQNIINGLGKRMTRLQTEPFELPAGWGFYQSLAGKSNAFVSRVRRGDHYALRLEADGYLAAIPRPITVTEEKIISFTVYAEKDSMLQFTRAGRGIGMLPMLLLPLKAGSHKRFEIRLDPYENCKSNSIWFWLDLGIIEISDVRLK